MNEDVSWRAHGPERDRPGPSGGKACGGSTRCDGHGGCGDAHSGGDQRAGAGAPVAVQAQRTLLLCADLEREDAECVRVSGVGRVTSAHASIAGMCRSVTMLSCVGKRPRASPFFPYTLTASYGAEASMAEPRASNARTGCGGHEKDIAGREHRERLLGARHDAVRWEQREEEHLHHPSPDPAHRL